LAFLKYVLHNVAPVCNALTMQNLLTAKQKAEELGISRSTLTRMVQAGKITPAFKADGPNGVTLFAPEFAPEKEVAA
jgi:hypothetical protein